MRYCGLNQAGILAMKPVPIGIYIGAFLLIAGCGADERNEVGASASDSVRMNEAGRSGGGGGASSEVIAEGQFEDRGGQSTSGRYRIERSEDGLRLVLSDDFRTDEGPDLHVVLSTTPLDQADNENALANGEALIVAPLEAQEGTQSYGLPDGTDPSDYHSVLIHCVEFTHLYGAAPMTFRESGSGL